MCSSDLTRPNFLKDKLNRKLNKFKQQEYGKHNKKEGLFAIVSEPTQEQKKPKVRESISSLWRRTKKRNPSPSELLNIADTQD